ncbi:hypothetical protein ACIA5G_31370 [Amycolatopsis sp. NPDC051758]|uniref:hypothetical protein n=1 Tax=Amycolatopsis sp. NPDC051758 TaxID=3363935 RepID=UPI0037B667B2
MQLGSARLATVVFAANLAGCALVGTVGTVLNRAPEPGPPSEPALAWGTTTTLPPSSSLLPPSETPATGEVLPGGLDRVRGPAGLETVLPRGWPTKTLPEPGSMQATDPDDPRRIVKFGGAPPSDGSDILTYHERYARQIAQRSGYVQYGLQPTTLRGHDAVDWEFAWDAPEGRRHVRAVYWRSGGLEYYVYLHGPESSWPATAELAERMLDASTP